MHLQAFIPLPLGRRPGRELGGVKPGALWELWFSGVEQEAPGSKALRLTASSSCPFTLSLLPPASRYSSLLLEPPLSLKPVEEVKLGASLNITH